MGDAINSETIALFLHSPAGRRHLDSLRRGFVGRRIKAVSFTNEIGRVGVLLRMDDGDLHEIALPRLDVDSIREDFHAALEREYQAENAGTGDASHGLRCPACGSCDAFAVEAWQSLTVHGDGTVTEGDEGQQWDGGSPCRCEECGHDGVVEDFAGEGTP